MIGLRKLTLFILHSRRMSLIYSSHDMCNESFNHGHTSNDSSTQNTCNVLSKLKTLLFNLTYVTNHTIICGWELFLKILLKDIMKRIYKWWYLIIHPNRKSYTFIWYPMWIWHAKEKGYIREKIKKKKSLNAFHVCKQLMSHYLFLK